MQEGTFQHYRKIQQVMSPEFCSAPFLTRLRHCVIGLISSGWTLDETMCLLPELRSFSTSSIISFWSTSGAWLSLSHLMAIGVGRELPKLDGKLLQPLSKGSYFSIIGDIARSSPDELSLCMQGTTATPLMAMVEQIYHRSQMTTSQIFDRVLQSAITSWASVLHVNGVNLLDYGCRERFSELSPRTGSITVRMKGTMRRHSCTRIIGITYGALPEQWKIWWSIYDYEYAGDFWQMVENSAFSIPGNWEVDFDSHEEDEHEGVPWDDDDRGDWIVWSEYRKIRPPY